MISTQTIFTKNSVLFFMWNFYCGCFQLPFGPPIWWWEMDSMCDLAAGVLWLVWWWWCWKWVRPVSVLWVEPGTFVMLTTADRPQVKLMKFQNTNTDKYIMFVFTLSWCNFQDFGVCVWEFYVLVYRVLQTLWCVLIHHSLNIEKKSDRNAPFSRSGEALDFPQISYSVRGL